MDYEKEEGRLLRMWEEICAEESPDDGEEELALDADIVENRDTDSESEQDCETTDDEENAPTPKIPRIPCFVGRDNTTNWWKHVPKRTSRTRQENIIVRLPGVKNYAKNAKTGLECWSLFCNDSTTKTATLVNAIKQTIRACHVAGLVVVSIVCDQATTNVAAINSLVNDTRGNYLKAGVDMQDKYFEIDGKKIIPLYDGPHLLKGIRNNFLSKNIKYVNNDKQKCTAKWQHIVDAYKIDLPCGRLRLMKKLINHHVGMKIKQIKVSCCSQVFSNQVASGMTRMSLDILYTLS
ncbi:hypothetical protein MML48_2g00015289 [Holotrichia oblita]|uniref:Uncharacterized protein n=1 Tax=Holotrichia oblita TaxID=644536 RepID=A0ACB9TLN0_HOLOL|nr:hypothetical protein MML48_2g00015289 [Holotrichia oblita]